MKIILASSSPRRKQLMDLGNFDYEILTGDIDETRNETLSIEEQSKDLAYRKAKFVYDNTQGDRVIIAAEMPESVIIVLKSLIFPNFFITCFPNLEWSTKRMLFSEFFMMSCLIELSISVLVTPYLVSMNPVPKNAVLK